MSRPVATRDRVDLIVMKAVAGQPIKEVRLARFANVEFATRQEVWRWLLDACNEEAE
jgi:hypothetical protein